jgi:hypothetical protein
MADITDIIYNILRHETRSSNKNILRINTYIYIYIYIYTSTSTLTSFRCVFLLSTVHKGIENNGLITYKTIQKRDKSGL